MYYNYIRECPCSDETHMGVFKDGGAWCLPLWKDSREKNIHTHKHTCRCCVQSLSRVRLFVTPWTVARQALLSMGFSRQEHWSGLPCPPPGDHPDPGIEPAFPKPPALAGRVFTISSTWEAQTHIWRANNKSLWKYKQLLALSRGHDEVFYTTLTALLQCWSHTQIKSHQNSYKGKEWDHSSLLGLCPRQSRLVLK